MSILQESMYLGAVVSLGAYYLGMTIKKKWKAAMLNPLLIAVIFTILFLVVFQIDYDTYYEGARYISYLLTPATVCLAIPLYEQFEILKKNWMAVLGGVLSGVITSMVSIGLMAFLFKFTWAEYVTFLPKSITTAIGMSLSEELGGYVSVTVASIVITGILGNVFAELVLKIFRIKDPVAKGIAIGTASHAIGTTKAMEMGEIEGALSSLSIVVAGILTVAGASLISIM